MKIYCRKCGSATIYSINKPESCDKCGNSFGHNTQASQKPSVSFSVKEEEKEVTNPFSIVGEAHKGIKLGDILENGPTKEK